MSLQSTKITRQGNLASKLKNIILFLRSNSNLTEAENDNHLTQLCEDASEAIFDEVHAWLDENKKTVQTQDPGGTSPGIWNEPGGDESGIDY